MNQPLQRKNRLTGQNLGPASSEAQALADNAMHQFMMGHKVFELNLLYSTNENKIFSFLQ